MVLTLAVKYFEILAPPFPSYLGLLLPARYSSGMKLSQYFKQSSFIRWDFKGKDFYICLYFKGKARTQSPTNKNYALESPTFGVIARFSQTQVQWKGLSKGKPPCWSWCSPCQVSMLQSVASRSLSSMVPPKMWCACNGGNKTPNKIIASTLHKMLYCIW